MKIALNGRICDDKDAVVSVYDHGFLYGIGLFETFRTYGGRPFLLEPHLRRLASGCEELGIGFTPDPAKLQLLVRRLLNENGLEDGYIRYSISAGTDVLGLPAGDYERPNEIIYVKPLPPRDERLYAEGKPIQLLRLRRNSPEGPTRYKSFHYMNNILGKRELQGCSWAVGAEGVFLDGSGHVAEGIVSNLFWIKNRIVYTPSLETGILPGITRSFVKDMLTEEGFELQEGLFGWAEVMEADEAFLTNSIQEIVPVSGGFTVEGQYKRIGSSVGPGPITRRLSEVYEQKINERGDGNERY